MNLTRSRREEREKTILRRIEDKLRTGRKYLLSKMGKELFKFSSKKTNHV